MGEALRRYRRQMSRIDLLDFELKPEEREEIVLLICLIDTLHQAGLTVP